MSFNIVYGKTNSNLKNECTRLVQKDVNNNNIQRVIIISDEKHKREIEIEIRDSNIIDPKLKIEITTFKELYAHTINMYGDKRLKLLNNEQQLALILCAINNIKDKLNLYRNLTTDITFAKKVLSTIQKLKQDMITPEILARNINNIKNELSKNKLIDLVEIYKSYSNICKEKFIDKEDLANYTKNLLQLNSTEYTNSVHIYKLEDVTQQEINIIETLTKKQTYLSIYIINDSVTRTPSNLSGEFFKPDTLVTKLMNIERSSVEINETYIKNFFESEELRHLESNLFKYPYSEFKEETSDLFLSECSTVEEEVEIVANTIDSLIHKDTPLSDIIVVTPNNNLYERYIGKVFNKCEIPYYTKSQKDLSSHALARFIEILLELYSTQTGENLIRLLKTGITVLDLQNIGILDRYLKKHKEIDFKEIALEDLSVIHFTQEEDLKMIINNLNNLFEMYNTNKSFDELYKSTFDFIENIGLKNVLIRNIDLELNEGNDSFSLVTWQELIRQLDYYSSALKERTITMEIFTQLLLLATKNLKYTAQSEKHGIKIDTIDNLKEGERYVFILGANEGVFPQKQKQDTIFTDRDIQELNSIGLLIGEDTISLVLRAQFNTYQTLTTANNKLFISYPLTGNDLSILKKSSIVGRIKQLFPNVQHHSTLWNINEHNRTLSCRLNLKNFNTLKLLAQEIYSFDKEEKLRAIKKIEKLNEVPLYKNYITDLIAGTTYNNEVLCEDKHTLQNLYYSDTLSVSKLEKYAKCPFAYFSEYALKVKADEPNKVQARHIGIIVHSIIEEFDKRLRKNNKTWESIAETYIDNDIDYIMDYLENRDSMSIFNSSPAAINYKKKLKHLSKTSIIALKHHIGNSFFECIGHEINFDEQGTYPPITIKLASGKRLKLRGQIDRLDEMKSNNGNFIRIVDYKTGNITLDFTEICHGTQLQLLTYLDAIIESGIDRKYLPAGAFYLKIDDPFIKANPNTTDEYVTEKKLKELRMKGLFTNNGSIAQYMDKGIYDGEYKTSLNIQAKFKTDGTLSKSTPGISMADLEVLRKYTKEIIKELATDMFIDANIDIKPIKKKAIEACTYCKYKCVCHFDETLYFNSFKYLQELSKEEVLNIANKKVGEVNE